MSEEEDWPEHSVPLRYCICPVAGGPATTAPQCPVHPMPSVQTEMPVPSGPSPAPRGTSEAEESPLGWYKAAVLYSGSWTRADMERYEARFKKALLAHVAQLAAQLKDTEEACDDYSKSLHQAEAEIKRLAAQRDEAGGKLLVLDTLYQSAAEEARELLVETQALTEQLPSAHAAGYAAAREEAAQAIVPIYDRIGRMEMRPGILDRKAEALMFDVFRCAILAPLAEAQVAIRALPSPAAPAQGTPKAGA